ncbi:MAG: hypothetical protein R6U20_13225, partial [Longimonas sp.]|uniref:hypothetical protein n=1 Tax=Longimonas sp. TaxID=2039626 RepID=UPI00397654EE
MLLVVALLLVGCDDTGTEGDTIIIGSDADPVEFEFEFEPFSADDVSSEGTITLTSTNTDDLGSQIQEFAGASRSEVVSAEVRLVQLERLTDNFSETIQPKVFSYLGSARVFYGASVDAQPIASSTPISDEPEIELSLDNDDITEVVRGGAQPLTLELEVNDPSLIGSSDEVEITVRYRIEVQV